MNSPVGGIWRAGEGSGREFQSIWRKLESNPQKRLPWDTYDADDPREQIARASCIVTNAMVVLRSTLQ